MGTRIVDEPDLAEVMGEESESLALPTRQEGPIRAQLLPCVDATSIARSVDTVTAACVLKTDPRRQRAVISTDKAIYLAFTQAEADAGTCAMLSATATIELHNTAPVWVRCADVAGTVAVVSIIAEQWTD